MEDESTQPNTQQVLDPRRLGRNNSGLNDSDIADVLCILHPASPAAFTIVAHTAEQSPQHVLQNEGLVNFTDRSLKNMLEEHETFLLGTNSSGHAKDLALRLSSTLKNPVLGFTFGRNPRSCDIVFDIDTVKRISNLHFRIYVTHAGIVMLEDMSTNGTLVDENHLRGKTQRVATQMLIQGSVIQVPSTKPEESIKFVVRIPSREGHDTAYLQNFQVFRARMDAAEREYRQQARTNHIGQANPVSGPVRQALAIENPAKAALVGSSNPFGMHWSGGNKYNVVGHLGKGAFATVFQLATKMDGHLYAAKELDKQRFVKNGRMDQKLENEMQIMKDLRHPNIVQYIDYHEENEYLYIIMEYIAFGDLQNYLSKYGPLHEPAAKLMARQTLKALQYLHRKRITHRDIKPDNILISSVNPFVVKLSDFGLSKVVKNNETFLKTFCGTLLYCAPEVFPHYDEHTAKRGTKRRRSGAQSDFHAYSQSVDIWSFAAVLWFALCYKPPFEGISDKTGKKMFDQIMGTPLDTSPLRGCGVSESAIKLLCKMLNTDPSERPNETQCLQHPWLTSLGQDSDYEMEDDLHSIAEEPEDDGAEEVFSQLSINDRPIVADIEQKEGNDEDYEMSPVDLDEMDFLDPRASKRVKEDLLVPRNQIRDQAALHSSPDELSDETDERHLLRGIPHQQRPGRLFGEISASALQSSGVLGEHINRALDVGLVRNGSSASDNSRSNGTSPPDRQITSDMNFSYEEMGPNESLGGAASIFRDLKMGSLESNVSADIGFEAVTKTPESAHGTPKATNTQNKELNGSDQETPKPKPAKFSRLIQLDVGPSFLYTPYDLSTQNLNYASNVNDRDFTAEGLATTSEEMDTTKLLNSSLRATMQPSTPQKLRTRSITTMTDPPGPVLPMTVPVEELDPPARLGMLVTSTDSFKPIFWKLNNRVEIWGRGPNNTLVYPDKHDVRVPKMGICIFHHAPGIEKLDRDGVDWRSIPKLHTLVATCSSVGIWVNGVKLKEKNENGNILCGRLYSGDVITAYASKEDEQCLRFVCKFEYGEARHPRPLDKRPFKIEEPGSGPKQMREQ